MKRSPCLILLICFIGTFANAQDVSGIVKYKGIINQKYIDSFLTVLETKKEVPMHIKQDVIDSYKSANPDDFILNFKNEESYYYLIPSLEETEYNIGSLASETNFYTNSVTDTIIETGSSLGNISFKTLDWKITQDTKKIGKYLCYKAKASEKLFSRQGFYYSKQVIAWFTPEIPVTFGPSNYSGLPGLILQVERDKFTLTATKINLSPDDKDIKIKRLSKDSRVITDEEANKRIEEMMEARKKEYGG
ncbi:GLPGLI family protein [Galbibacter mesophilus]|uniref:GLPGLI family protein n=1 Tax=Galbibacter mesophilus TaxID=379069 RepID=UPI00191EB2C0|nr:GLPGLI family protein [Galbibacter mesophilus]MCM5662587.1 GLPGLI family protein [Galbibacter mesophilus]